MLGGKVTTTQDNSVVLGYESTDREATTETGVTLRGTAYTFAGQGSPANGVVSVGDAGKERQIINVAAGKVSADSTDAVNGSQLYATNEAVNSIVTGGGGIKYFHATSAAPDSAATGADSVAVGPNTTASGKNSIAIGANNALTTTATGANSVVVGASSSAVADNATALGAGANAWANASIAIGRTSSAGGASSVAIGDASRALDIQAVALGYGTNANKMATALGSGAQAKGIGSIAISGDPSAFFNTGADALGADSIAIGQQLKADAAKAIAFGYRAQATAAADTSIAMGNTAKTSASKTIAIGNAAQAGGAQAIAMGDGAQATGTQSISIGTGNKVSGNNSGAIGDPTIITGSGTYTVGNNNGTVSANNAGAFGNDNTLTGDNSRIVGNSNSVTTVDTFVVGNGVTATQANSVVLGNLSTDREATTETGVTLNGTAYTYAGQGSAANGVVSVGAAGAERQIINVAAGNVSDTSTDAINGSQLHATNLALEDLGDHAVQYDENPDGTVNYDSVTLGDGSSPVSTDGGVTGGTTITNVHQGDVNATSTDAINGAQLYQIAGDTSNTYITSNGRGIRYVRTNDTGLPEDDAHATVAGATALGYNATASHEQSVAIGRDSVADGSKLANAAYNPGTGTLAGATAVGEVSIGTAGSERRLTNVAAGADDTDAVNVSQLKSLASDMAAADAGNVKYDKNPDGTVNYDSVTLGDGSSPVSTDGGVTGGTTITNVHQGELSATSTDAVNGSQLFAATAAATTEVTAGNNVTVEKTAGSDGHAIYKVNAKGTTVSAGSSALTVTPGAEDANNVTDYAVDLSAETKTKLNNSVQYDDATHTSVTMGGPTSIDGGVTGGTTITNVHQGDVSENSTDVINGSQLYQIAGDTSVTYITNNGAGVKYVRTNDTGLAPNDAHASGQAATAVGYNAQASATNSLALGRDSVASHDGAVALGSGSVTNRDNSVSVGAPGAERQITNVAPGTAGTDAVNVDQLNAAQAGVGNQIASVRSDMRSLDNHLSAGVAAAMATAGLPQAYLPGKSMLSMAGATWNGESGMALGLSTVSDNGKWVVKGSANSSSRGDYGAAVGVGYQW